MKTLLRFFLLCTIALFSTTLSAQQKATPSWSAKCKSPVNWQRIHSLGYLIVSTKDALYGVNPVDGKILWENKNFPALDPSRFEEVQGTEFVSISFMTEKSARIP